MVEDCKIDPKEILAISFTNKAAKEMKERVISLLGKRRTRGMTLLTFHALGVRILRQEITRLGYHKNFSIFDTNDQLSIIKDGLKTFRGGKEFKRELIQSQISFLKNHTISCEEFPNTSHYDEDNPYHIATEYIYQFYQDKLRFYNAIDFDDILFLTVEIFKRRQDVAQLYSNKFKYIMVDEYQDTNTPQFQLIMALTSQHQNICVVGDDDQAIYSFRGADISNILDFEKVFPGAKMVKLEENYRSSNTILELANQVIKQNIKRKDKTLWTAKQSTQKPILWTMADTDHESQVLASEISKLQATGIHLAEVAILYRSNTQTQPIEDQLILNQIPYTILGGKKFFDRKEIKDLIAYLSVIKNPSDELSLRRILNVPNRGIGLATLNKFLDSRTNDETLFSLLSKHPELAGPRRQKIEDFTALINSFQQVFKEKPLDVGLENLIDRLDYYEYIEKQYDVAKHVEMKKKNVMRMVDSTQSFMKHFKSFATLENYVDKLLLKELQENEDEKEDDDVRANKIVLMTLHSSKGLEFDYVYLVGAEEGILPHKKSITQGDDISEERRLFYVGITRAREKLFMTVCKERKIHGNMVPRFPSRFLGGMEEFYQSQDRTRFEHLSSEEEKDYKDNFFSGLLDLLDEEEKN